MTQDKNTDLTPEEQAEIAATMPALLESITKGSPAAPGWLAHWRGQRGISEEAKEQADAIRQEVAAAPPEQGYLAQWCGFPTDMTRCSPFFPLNPKELGERRYLKNSLITSANWGELRYSGPQLSTYEEDALLALLVVLEKQSRYRIISYAHEAETYYDRTTSFFEPELTVEECIGDLPFPEIARKTFTYKGPVLPIIRILYGNKTPNSGYYRRLIDSLRLMMSSVVEMSLSNGKSRSGKKRAPRKLQMVNMLAGVYWDETRKELAVTINPFFYEMYLAGRVTLMDVTKRMSLKGTISKALYRFVQSQRSNPIFVGHFLTLSDALNMDREQPAKEIRRLLKTAINELIRQGVLMEKSGFVEQDIIKLNRSSKALPIAERKEQKNTA